MQSLRVRILLVLLTQARRAMSATPLWQPLLNLLSPPKPPAPPLLRPLHNLPPSNQHLNPLPIGAPPPSNAAHNPSLNSLWYFNPLENLAPKPRNSANAEALRLPNRKTRDLVKVYGIDRHQCRQATIPKNFEALFVSVASLRRGSCNSQGFDEKVGTETFAVPFLGNIPIKVFQKVESRDASQSIKPKPELIVQTFREAVSISAVVLSSLFACSGVTIAMLRFRRSISSTNEQPLCSA